MSWSLQLRNSDLALGGTQLAQVTDFQKLVQDLRCALLEHRGSDDMHPTYGSIIDGGFDQNGIEVISLIGTNDFQYAIHLIESEIKRVAAYHQASQVQRSKNDRLTYGESTLTPSELLVSIKNINFAQAQDKLVVNVVLQTAAGTTNVQIPIFR